MKKQKKKKKKKKQNFFIRCFFHFLLLKFSVYLNRHVFIMNVKNISEDTGKCNNQETQPPRGTRRRRDDIF